MRRLFSILIFLTIILVALFSLKPDSEHSTETIEGLPWQIEALPDGRSRVFGVTLGHSTLEDARKQLGDDMELAIVVAPGKDTGGLEMFYGHYKAGVFSGKLVIAADLAPADVAQLVEHAIKSDYMDSGARKFTLGPDDLPRALRTPVASMAFIPVVNLDETSAIKRFGPADKTVHVDEHITRLLYPAKGLEIIINNKGKDVLQYVAPGDFERLIK
ncbi:hypothetical protein DFR30_1697 [Thiogranum longum]|uniref:Uncharacterized protein n=1 Tax=Thiogranum longum TaxID=1537524 RepID=A0A4R1HGG9_9GAMM|nr:hypothetical protein [Thiogranum longum]TCK18419.1 hypothetical protein DFR30_1697 [Thiogranum longum]